MNINQSEEQYIMIRNTKNINIANLDYDLINHQLYQKTINETDPDTISNNIISIINDKRFFLGKIRF